MAGEERSERQGRAAYDKTLSAPRSGSIGLVLLVAVVLIGVAAGAVYIPPAYSGIYILALLAILSAIGVIGLFAAAAGILRSGGRKATHPLLKSVADNDPTACSSPTIPAASSMPTPPTRPDRCGRADESARSNGFSSANPDVSEAIYRLPKRRAKAGGCRKRCAFRGAGRARRAGCACACGRWARAGPDARWRCGPSPT